MKRPSATHPDGGQFSGIWLWKLDDSTTVRVGTHRRTAAVLPVLPAKHFCERRRRLHAPGLQEIDWLAARIQNAERLRRAGHGSRGSLPCIKVESIEFRPEWHLSSAVRSACPTQRTNQGSCRPSTVGESRRTSTECCLPLKQAVPALS